MGVTPDPNHRQPASRLSFAFWSGVGTGPLGSSRVDVSFTPSTSGVSNLPMSPMFEGVWEVSWDREDWEFFDFFLHFTETEFEDFDSSVWVYYSQNPDGPWEQAGQFGSSTGPRPVLPYFIGEDSSPEKQEPNHRYYLTVLEYEDDDEFPGEGSKATGDTRREGGRR